MRDNQEQAARLQQNKRIPGYLHRVPDMLDHLKAGDEIEAGCSELIRGENPAFEVATNCWLSGLDRGNRRLHANDFAKSQGQQFLYEGTVACPDIESTSPSWQRGQVGF